jgi:CubicO group peptidase (beta-lactamase class C family)
LTGGASTDGLGGLRVLLVEAAARGVAPRLDAAIWVAGELHQFSSTDGPPALFDLASLTKPLASGLVALSLAAEGLLDLEARGSDGASARQLLDHSAGYAEWRPLFKVCFGDETARRIFLSPWQRARDAGGFDRGRHLMTEVVSVTGPALSPGERTVYSDLGFLKLQQRLEAAGQDTLATVFARRVAQPFGVDLRFIDLTQPLTPPQPGASPVPEAMPTGHLRPRPPAPGQERDLAGVPVSEVGFAAAQVDDDNAFALGGIAGHAGLFGTVEAVAVAGARFLEECEGARRLGPPDLAALFCGPSGPGGKGLGWDRPSGASSLGTLLGRGALGAVGHLGYTGTSLWIDRDRRLSVALCTNRVRHGRDNLLIRDFRPRFHDAVARTFGLA